MTVFLDACALIYLIEAKEPFHSQVVAAPFFAARDLTLVELTPDVIEGALRIRAATGLRTPDAIQAACALTLPDKDRLFLTNDRGFDRVATLNLVVLATSEGG